MDGRVVELFAGVGGFRLGLQAAGWDVVWSNQWEPNRKAQWASDCYVHHFGPKEHSNEDIATVDADDIPDHDLLVGGFPCQDYSVATTKAQGIQGKKGVLWWEIERILRAKRPPYVLLENVDRLLRSPTDQRGRDFGVLLWCMANLGYRVEWRVINAADYGFPQKRRRTFILGAHRETPVGKALAEGAEKATYLLKEGFFAQEFPTVQRQVLLDTPEPRDAVLPQAAQHVSDEFSFHFKNAGLLVGRSIWTRRVDARREDKHTLEQVLDADVDERYFVPEEDVSDWKYVKGAKSIERTSKNGHKYQYKEGAIPFPDSLDEPARTILTGEGGKSPSRSKHIVRDPRVGRLRVLTPEEAEKISGFPPGWTDTGMPENWRYFCMGNALVVGLVERMGARLSALIPILNRTTNPKGHPFLESSRITRNLGPTPLMT